MGGAVQGELGGRVVGLADWGGACVRVRFPGGVEEREAMVFCLVVGVFPIPLGCRETFHQFFPLFFSRQQVILP